MGILQELEKKRARSPESLMTAMNDRVYQSLIDEIKTRSQADAQEAVRAEVEQIRTELDEVKSERDEAQRERFEAIAKHKASAELAVQFETKANQLSALLKIEQAVVKPDNTEETNRLKSELEQEKQITGRLERQVDALEGQLSVKPEPQIIQPMEIPDFEFIPERSGDGRIKSMKAKAVRVN